MNGHTKGPEPIAIYGSATKPMPGANIAWLVNGVGIFETKESAELASAAPDLLAALENSASLLRALSTPDDAIAQTALREADAAITRAKASNEGVDHD